MKKYLSYDDLKRTRPCDKFLEDFKELFDDEMLVNRENIDLLRMKMIGGGWQGQGWQMHETFSSLLKFESGDSVAYDSRVDNDEDYIDVFIELYSGGAKMSLVDKIVKAALK